MPLSDTELRADLRELISEVGRRKREIGNRVGWMGFLVAVASSAGIVVFMSATSVLEWWIRGITALVVFVVLFFGAFAFEDPLTQRDIRRTAKRFRQRFPTETGDYERATALLKGIKSDSGVEKDLLKALGWDVTFADEDTTELLGDFNKSEVENPGAENQVKATDAADEPGGSAASEDPAPPANAGYIPLDPYEPTRQAANEPADAESEVAAIGASDETARHRR